MTSLHALNFTLLPRPARSIFSLGDEATRATLPDFASVEQLAEFVQRLHVWRFQVPGTFVHFKFGANYIAFLLLVIALIIARRMYEKSFWLVRILKKPTGRVIVPNAMLAFSAIEGVFAAIFVAFLWLYCRWFDDGSSSNSKSSPADPILWLGMTWCPLICGVMWAAWGTYFATPSSDQLRFGMHERSRLQSFLGHAMTINALGLLCPMAVIVTLIGPAIISNAGYMRSLRKGQEWQTEYGKQTRFTQAMVQDAQRVWQHATESMWMANVMFICWTAYALAMAAGYGVISWRLLMSIRREVQKREEAPVRVLGIMTTYVLANGRADKDEGDGSIIGAGDDDVELCNKSQDGGAPKSSHLPVLNHRDSTRIDSRSRAASWRRLVPNFVMQKSTCTEPAMADSRSKQSRELRKAFVHIFVQLLAISPACVAMASVALLLAVTMYGATEQPSTTGGTRFEYFLNVALLLIIYTICPAGSVTLLGIAQRTYEPVFHRSNTSSGGEGGSNGSGNRSASRNGGGSGARKLNGRFARMLGRSDPQVPTAKRSTGHAMSTFFETRTRANRPSTAKGDVERDGQVSAPPPPPPPLPAGPSTLLPQSDELATMYSQASAQRDSSADGLLSPSLAVSMPPPPPRAHVAHAASESLPATAVAGRVRRPHPSVSVHRSGDSGPISVSTTSTSATKQRGQPAAAASLCDS